jgi:hypothetical protein
LQEFEQIFIGFPADEMNPGKIPRDHACSPRFQYKLAD